MGQLNTMKKENLIKVLIAGIFIVFAIWFIWQTYQQADENGNVCAYKDEFTSYIEQQSKEHREFCFDKKREEERGGKR